MLQNLEHTSDDNTESGPSTSPSRSDISASTSQSSSCAEQPERGLIQYPAPLPKFTDTVEKVLTSGNKSKVMLIYSDIVKEAMNFYANIIPSETARAKLSMANVGRSVIERYPVLAVSDRSQPWSHFNDKLSSHLRNARSRIKHKLENSSPRAMKMVKMSNPAKHRTITESEYSQFVAELKAEAAKRSPDLEHSKELLGATFDLRRQWIDKTPSDKLTMSSILEEFPCLKSPPMLKEELALVKGLESVSGFAGEFGLISILSNMCLIQHHLLWLVYLCDDSYYSQCSSSVFLYCCQK